MPQLKDHLLHILLFLLVPDVDAKILYGGVDFIIDTLKNNKDVSIIALGPLTNIAKAIMKDKKAFDNLDEFISMGGAFRIPVLLQVLFQEVIPLLYILVCQVFDTFEVLLEHFLLLIVRVHFRLLL